MQNFEEAIESEALNCIGISYLEIKISGFQFSVEVSGHRPGKNAGTSFLNSVWMSPMGLWKTPQSGTGRDPVLLKTLNAIL